MKPKHAEPERKPLNIILPPDFIFKYRERPRVNPEMNVIAKQGTFDFVGVKYPTIYAKPDSFFEQTNMKRDWFKYPVTFSNGQIFVHNGYPPLTEEEAKMGGQLACFKDVPYPMKGHPFPQAMYAVNQAKHLTRGLVEIVAAKEMRGFGVLFALMPYHRKILILQHWLRVYVSMCHKAMAPFILGIEFMSKYGQEIYKFVSQFLAKMGVNEGLAQEFAHCFASQIDWDNAYWMRLGDAMLNTTKERMLKNPRRELLYLAVLMKERNPTDQPTADRIEKGIKIISYILLLPKYKRIFKECVEESNFENFQFDRADDYHSWVYSDYNYGGETLEERLKRYKDYHAKHPPEPMRLEINR